MRLLAILCAFTFIGCLDQQQGLFEVSRHQVLQADPGFTEVDVFYGRSMHSNAEEKVLMCIVFSDMGAQSTRSDRSYSSQGNATVCRVAFQEGPSSVTYGCHWNRETDLLTIGSAEFNRGKGNVFIILGPNAPEPRYVQLEASITSIDELSNVLRDVSEIRNDIPHFLIRK